MKKKRKEDEVEQISDPVEADPCEGCEEVAPREVKAIVYGDLLARCYEVAKDVMEREGMDAHSAIDYRIAENSHARQTKIALALFHRCTRGVPAMEKLFSMGLEFLCLLMKDKEEDRKRQEEIRASMPTFTRGPSVAPGDCKHPGLRILHDFWEAGQETCAPEMQKRSAQTADVTMEALSFEADFLEDLQKPPRTATALLCPQCRKILELSKVKSGEVWQDEPDEEEAEEDEETEGLREPAGESDPVGPGTVADIEWCKHPGLRALHELWNMGPYLRRAASRIIQARIVREIPPYSRDCLRCSLCQQLFSVDAVKSGEVEVWEGEQDDAEPEAGASFLRYMDSKSEGFREAGPKGNEHDTERERPGKPYSEAPFVMPAPDDSAKAVIRGIGMGIAHEPAFSEALREVLHRRHTGGGEVRVFKYSDIGDGVLMGHIPVKTAAENPDIAGTLLKLYGEGRYRLALWDCPHHQHSSHDLTVKAPPDWLKEDLKKTSFERMRDSARAVADGGGFVGVYKQKRSGRAVYKCDVDAVDALRIPGFIDGIVRDYGKGRYIFAVRTGKGKFHSDHIFSI